LETEKPGDASNRQILARWELGDFEDVTNIPLITANGGREF
jgi:hypothetical protein